VYFTRAQLEKQLQVEDAAAEWQRRHDEEVGGWQQLGDLDYLS
jgi:hypothetical protein